MTRVYIKRHDFGRGGSIAITQVNEEGEEMALSRGNRGRTDHTLDFDLVVGSGRAPSFAFYDDELEVFVQAPNVTRL